MLKEWQFNVLFFVGVGGAVVALVGPWIGLDIAKNPTAITGVGAILAYILTQKNAWTRNGTEKDKKPDPPPAKEVENDGTR